MNLATRHVTAGCRVVRKFKRCLTAACRRNFSNAPRTLRSFVHHNKARVTTISSSHLISFLRTRLSGNSTHRAPQLWRKSRPSDKGQRSKSPRTWHNSVIWHSQIDLVAHVMQFRGKTAHTMKGYTQGRTKSEVYVWLKLCRQREFA